MPLDETNRLPSASKVRPNRLPPPSQNSSNRRDSGWKRQTACWNSRPRTWLLDVLPVTAVEPAVRPPGEVVGQRLGVLHAEAGQQHLGIAVGHVVAVLVGVEEQVGDLEDVDAAVAEGQPGAKVQAGDKVLEAVGAAVAVGVLADGDAVGPPGPLGGGSGTRS